MPCRTIRCDDEEAVLFALVVQYLLSCREIVGVYLNGELLAVTLFLKGALAVANALNA